MGRNLVVIGFIAATFPTSALGQVPVGPEFRVNTYTTGDQTSGSIASDEAGNFVIAWTSYPQDGSSYGVFARRYARDATPLDAVEFGVSEVTLGSQSGLGVAATPDGRLSFAWNGEDGSGTGIRGRLFDASGAPATGEFGVNDYTTRNQFGPAIQADSAGNFVVVWTRYVDAVGNESEIVGRRFDSIGAPLGDEFAVNSYTTGRQASLSLAMRGDGGFIVVWGGPNGQIGARTVFGQRFDRTGSPLGGEFQVNDHTTSVALNPSVASDAAGNFVVVWRGFGQPGGHQSDLVAKRFDAAGASLGPEFIVNSITTGDQMFHSVALDPRGNFVVVWSGPGSAQNFDVFGRAFDSAGPLSDDFALGTMVAGPRSGPTIVSDAAGDFVVAWVSSDAPGSFGVVARRFLSDLIFKDGFEAGSLSSWSSSASDGGDLMTSPAAALDSTATGLEGNVNDTAALYVQDDSPRDERRYRARLWIDTNGFDPGSSQGHVRTRVLITFSEMPSRRVAAIVLRKQAGLYSLSARARLDDDAQADTGFFAVSDGPHAIELDLAAASGPDAQDGTLEFFVDGTSQVQLTGLDNSLAAVDFVRMGALSVKTGATGTLYWDEFESRRLSYIGP